MLSEVELIAQIRRFAGTQSRQPRLIKGIGDDCAILRPNPRHDLVFTTDFVLEGRHFTLDTHKPADIGHKALARSLSDLAAMGSKPLFCLVSLAVPQTMGKHFIDGFYKGLLRLARDQTVTLAGGDLAAFDKVVADVVCCGEVPAGKALLRSNARSGDAIFVTGELGGSAHGLRMGRGPNFRRHLRPQPRIELARLLRDLGVRCCMDISDGLALDLKRVCQESGVSAVLDLIPPAAKGATQDEVMTGGEDYELLFTAPKKVRIPSELDGIAVTRIGHMTRKARYALTLNGQELTLGGFDHFRQEQSRKA